MRNVPSLTRTAWTVVLLLLTAVVAASDRVDAQEPVPPPCETTTLTLRAALDMARRASPELTAAREAVAAAVGRERQASAFPNPSLSYQREQTSRNSAANSQNIASVEQPFELGGQRGARTQAAKLRREAAEARLQGAQSQLDHDVTRAFAVAVAAERRATLARQAANAFGRARTVSQTRLAQGDVSGYANRRIQLEAARYGALLAEALLARRTARLVLASLVAAPTDRMLDGALMDDSARARTVTPPLDSLRGLANRHRAELRAARLGADAAAAEARLAGRGRIPVPVLSAGLKNEQVVSGETFNGFVAGVSLPIPLWDRRRGTIDAAAADARRRVAEADVVRRRVAREVEEAAASLSAVEEQLAVLGPQLGAESRAALRAAEVAYSEGEITLLEWLDAVRAYQEAESTFATLSAESLVRRAALERAVGVSLSRD